jgi:hypothetical protein
MRTIHAALLAAAVSGLSSSALADELLALDGSGVLHRFDTAGGPTFVQAPITGTGDEGRLLAIELRPRSGVLYGLTSDRLYSIDLNSGVATPAGPQLASGARDAAFGFDPLRDVGRLLVRQTPPGPDDTTITEHVYFVLPDTGVLDARIDPNSGQSPRLSYVPGDPAEGESPAVTSIAWSTTALTAYGIERPRGTLVRLGTAGGALSAANDLDVVSTVAPITGLHEGARIDAFGIDAYGTAVIAAIDAGQPISGLWKLDLATGAAVRFASMPGGRYAVDFAHLPTATLPSSVPLDVRNATVRLDFRGARRADEIRIVGTLPFPTYGWAGKTMRVDVGGVVREFMLDIRGRGVQGPDSVRFGRNSKTEAGFPFTLLIRRDRFLRGVFQQGAAEADRPVALDVYLDGRVHRATLEFDYVSRGARGTARLAKD